MNAPHANSKTSPLSRRQQLRESVLLFFCEPIHTECFRLFHLTRSEWTELLLWLDTSGLALYFFDRLKELDLVETLPPHIAARLEQSVVQNTERIEAMISESNSIQLALQDLGVVYAVLKGFSLCPISVPRLELRSQLDLDFLVAEEHALRASSVLEEHGYQRKAVSGRSWEYKANAGSMSSLKDLYKSDKSRSAELHLEAPTSREASLLRRLERVSFRGLSMPVLSPVDLFLGQALHLYKHLLSELSRTAHVIEFRRHVIARYDDAFFWRQLRNHVQDKSDICVRLGIVLYLTSLVMGKFAPEALTLWTSDQLPARVCLWLDRYGHRIVLASFPGSKLYLLLQKDLETAGVPAKRSRFASLIPRRLPPAITHRVPGESFSTTLRRQLRELRFIAFRLRFHAVEGSRYLFESIVWRQFKSRLPE